MMKRFLVFGVALLSLGAAGVAAANPGFGGGLRHALGQLELTETQETEIRAVFTEARASRDDVRAELDAIRAEFRAELQKEAPSERALHALVDRRAQITTEQAHAMVGPLLEVHRILTPEQRAELAELMDEARENRGHGRGGPPAGGARGSSGAPDWRR
jgi:Spy/CpxP family protein refolding chaperone